MDICEKCGGEGLIALGESIKNICADCTGTGKVAAAEVTESAPVSEVESEISSESFLGESGESGEAPVSEELPAEDLVVE